MNDAVLGCISLLVPHYLTLGLHQSTLSPQCSHHTRGRHRRQQRTCGTFITHTSVIAVGDARVSVCQTGATVKCGVPDWEPIEWADCGPSTLSRVSSGAHCRPAVYVCTACPHSRCGLQACPQEAMWGDPQNCCGLCIGTLSSLPTLPDSYSYCYPLLASTGTFARMGWEYFHQNQNCNHSPPCRHVQARAPWFHHTAQEITTEAQVQRGKMGLPLIDGKIADHLKKEAGLQWEKKDGNITFLWICSQNLLVTPWTLLCVYLLDILLEYTELQSLVQSDLSMLPNVLQTPLMVKNLMNHVQDTVHLQRNTNVSLIGRWCRHVSYW